MIIGDPGKQKRFVGFSVRGFGLKEPRVSGFVSSGFRCRGLDTPCRSYSN